MEIINNYTSTALLLNYPIHFLLYDDKELVLEFNMKIPTVGMLYCDMKIQSTLAILNTDLVELEKQFSFISNLQSVYDLFNILSKVYDGKNYLNKYIDDLIYLYNTLGIPLSIKNNQLFIQETVLDKSVFDNISKILLLTCDLKKEDDFIDDPKLQAAKAKINKIKQQKQKNANKEDFLDVFMILTYEYKYKPDEISNMNIYQMNKILSYINKCLEYKVSMIAVGNGLTKKLKFFTTKKEKK